MVIVAAKFCLTNPIVAFDNSITLANFKGSSEVMVISADSIAISVDLPPKATPISA